MKWGGGELDQSEAQKKPAAESKQASAAMEQHQLDLLDGEEEQHIHSWGKNSTVWLLELEKIVLFLFF